jgi:hypothetical protein
VGIVSPTARPPRRLLSAAASVGALLVLTGCVPEYLGKVDEGQDRVDRAIAEAGLADEVSAEYTCSAALPFTATDCGARVTITSDDLGVVERAGSVDALRAEAGSWTVVYRGVEYRGDLDDLRRVDAIAEALPPGLPIASVSVSGGSARILMDGVPDFAQLCALGSTTPLSGSMSSRIGGRTDLELDLAVVGAESFASACRLADDAVAALGLDSLTTVGIEPGDAGAVDVTVIPDSQSAWEDARGWADTVAVPAGVALHVPIYY